LILEKGNRFGISKNTQIHNKILKLPEIDIGSSTKKVRAIIIEDSSESEEMLSLDDTG
jgi:hypothetical protein